MAVGIAQRLQNFHALAIHFQQRIVARIRQGKLPFSDLAARLVAD